MSAERVSEQEEAAHLLTIDQRDVAEDAFAKAYLLVMGRAPEWSNVFGYVHALEDIDEELAALQKASGDRSQEGKDVR